MKNFARKSLKSSNGITLIALVITIIILLILAGISIGTLSGDSGIINQARNAKKISEIAEEKEIIEAAAVQAMGENKYGDLTKDNLQNQINNYTNQDKSVEVEKNGNDLIVSFIKSGRTYIVDNDGNCKEVDWLQRSDGTIINKDGTIILKIGDYVDYDHKAGVDLEDEKKSTYKSLEENNGYGEQTFNLDDYAHRWRVLGVEGGKILLIAEFPMTTHSGKEFFF